MKKLLTLLTLVLALLSASALAADADTETALWPACDPVTGLWGYITEDGAWGIAPQYRHAYDFMNGYAEVGMNDHYTAGGIIDETGAYIFAPEYYVGRGTIGYDTWMYNGVYILEKDDLWGWFDTESGYISGLCWTSVDSIDDSPYVLARVGDRATFVNRATGERLLPLMDMDSFGFWEDRAMLWIGDEEQFIMIGLDGREIQLPEGLEAEDYAFSEGLLVVEDENGLYGYVDLNGQLVIAPQYTDAWGFNHGYAVVNESLLIDREGCVISEDVHNVCGPWADNGIAVEREGCWAVLNSDGTERFRIELKPYEYGRCVRTYEPLVEGGPWWVEYRYPAVCSDFGLMTAEGEWIRQADTGEDGLALADELFSDDPMGWHAAWCDGKWGYIDGAGNTILPFIYEEAGHFDGALARVRFDESTEGYVNRAGETVYQWPSACGTR